MDRALWAITYLRKAGLLESVSWGVFRITARGNQLLEEKPATLLARDLERYPEYLEFKGGGSSGRAEAKVVDSRSTASTPDEDFHDLVRTIQEDLQAELLDLFRKSTPSFFEEAVVKLLVAMGYGGSVEDAGHATKRSGDDGIDGVIKEDRLGLDVIHVQAKRWTDRIVGRPDIQSFAGSLEGQRGRKGVFITTSQFSAEAKEYVSRIEKKIVLIDGKELARLCVMFDIGVSRREVIVLKAIDPMFFAEK